MSTLEIHFQLAAFEGHDLFVASGDPAFLVAINEAFEASVSQIVFASPWTTFGSEQAAINVFAVGDTESAIVLDELNRKEFSFGFLNQLAEFVLFVHGLLLFLLRG
jgi:hypothetical protein